MRRKPYFLPLSLCLIISLLLIIPGCTKRNVSPASSSDAIVITMDKNSEPQSGFDPIMGWAAGEHTHDPLIQSTLLRTNDDLTIGYDLASSYSISSDGLTWTFDIKPDIKFSDDAPLKASDVAFTYNNALLQVTETDLSMLDSVEVVSDQRVVFHLKRPYSPFAYLAAVIGIVPEHAYNAETYGRKPIGSGRYLLSQWDKGEQVILEANPNYYGEAPKIKKVTIVFMSEDASYAAAKSGQIDVAYTAPHYTANSIDGYKILSFPSVDIRGINMPCILAGNHTAINSNGNSLPAGNNVTAERALRQAISYAIDREKLVANVLLGHGTVAYSDSKNEPWDNTNMQVPFDPSKARSILEADGWKINAAGVYEKNLVPAEFDLLYIASDSVRTGLVMAVKEMLHDVGIKVNPIGSSWDQIQNLCYKTPHLFGAGMHSPAGLISHYYTGKNRASYSNSTVDHYIDQALSASRVEASYPYWNKVYWDGSQGVAPMGDSPWVWLVQINHVYFAKENLQLIDKKIHPHGYGWTILNNVDQWYWEQ